jgi:hypothetical protein
MPVAASLLIQSCHVITRIFSDIPPVILHKKLRATPVQIQDVFDALVFVTAVRGDMERNRSAAFIE